jgi:heat shock protein 90kDa beta
MLCIGRPDKRNNYYSFTDDEVIKREEEAIKLDGLNVAQIKELRDKSEKFAFQAEVNRMMKLIINSLYRNKEVYFLDHLR